MVKIRKWQNLIHGKCPDCDARMIKMTVELACPDDKCHFIIKRSKVAEILRDTHHKAIQFASDHEKLLITKALEEVES